jgi:Cytosol aminopeptidase family, N-terminal domain
MTTMATTAGTERSRARAIFVAVVMLQSWTAPARADAPADKPAAVGSEARAGEFDGLTVAVKVEGPSAQQTPLQVACVFEYVEGDLTNPPALPAAVNGMVHLDQSLHGLITELRKSGRFAGHALETLLIIPPKGTVAADRLLLIGLGNRNEFSPAVLQRVGAVGMREALRLGVTAYSHASDIKDAGVDSPVGPNAAAVVTGALEALATQRYLADRGAAPRPSVGSLTLLAGPTFFAATTAAVRELLSHRAPR